MLYLSKEASTKDQNLKTQMLMTLNDDSDSRKTIWKSSGFFKEQRTDLTIKKPDFPENTLVYLNQGSISVIKGEQAIYLEFVTLGQILPSANPDPKINLDNHDFKGNEVLLFFPSDNTETGLYQGLRKKLRSITLRGDVNKCSLAMDIIRKAVKSYSVLSSCQFQTFFIILYLRNK